MMNFKAFHMSERGESHLHDGRVCQDSHTKDYSNPHQNQGATLQEAYKKVFAFYNVLLCNGKQYGKQNIVGFPGILETLKNSKSYKKHAAKNRVSGQEEHQPENQK